MVERRDDYLNRGLKLMGLGALFVAGGLLLWFGGQLLLLAFAGILLAVVLRVPIGILVRRTALPERLAFILVVLAIIALVVAFWVAVGPSLVDQGAILREQIPESLESIELFLLERSWGQWLVGLVGAADVDASAAGQVIPGVTSQLGSAARSLWIAIANLVFVVVLALYLALAPETYRRGLIRLFPADRQDEARVVIDELGLTLRAWLVGQLLLMLLTGTLTGIGLAIVGVPLVLVLSVIAGLMNFIPLVGPILGFIPIVLVALAEGGSALLWVTVLYLAVQQIEGGLLTPLIQQRAVDLPPALTLAAVFLGGMLFGALGVIIATPLMAVLFVLVKMLYLREVLGQRVQVPGREGRI